MPPVDITKPEIIKFYSEIYEKTAILRMKWNEIHKEKLLKAVQFTGEEKGYTEKDVSRSVMESCMVASKADNINAAVNRKKLQAPYYVPGIKDYRKTHTIPKVGLGDPKDDPRLAKPNDDLSFDPVMRPVSPEQTDMIYKGLPEYGRLKYLKERNHINPEDKYYFQESMGWQYGWRMKDSFFGRNAPQYPNQGLLHKSLINRTGCQPDPIYYKSTTALMAGRQAVLSTTT